YHGANARIERLPARASANLPAMVEGGAADGEETREHAIGRRRASAAARSPVELLADRIAVVIGSDAVSSVMSLAEQVLLVRLLDKTEYGTWSFLMVLLGTGRDAALASIPESILYFAPKLAPAELRGLARQSMRILAVFALAVACAFVALALVPPLG